MDGLGCFRLSENFYHPQFRPCNVLPQPRSLINTRFILFTKTNMNQGRFLVINNATSFNTSDFDAKRPTKFIIHGFQENPLHDHWILAMKDEILKNNDSNVVIVDWSEGSHSSYTQATANARVVGAELAELIKALESSANLSASSVHIIGHGLGAHIAGYTAERLSPRLARITGLDPSYKFFCNMPESVRLDRGDADFVDVIHTELHGYDSGHGSCHVLGHVDFFPNGGGHQPGCHDVFSSAPPSNGIYSGYHGHHGIGKCGDQRAVSLFISTIASQNCKMIGYWCRSYKAFLRGECADCGEDGNRCLTMGIFAENQTAVATNYSSMYLVTGKHHPFCLYEYRLRMLLNMSELLHGDHSPRGSLLVALKGEKRPLLVHLSFYSLHRGKEYTFLVTTPIDIGEIKNVSVRWEEYGSYDKGWDFGDGVLYFRKFNAEVDKVHVTRLNDIRPSERNRSSQEIEYCKSDSSDNNRTPGWVTYLPNC